MAPPPGPGGVSNTGTFWTRAFWRRLQMDDVVMKRAKTTLMRDALCLPRCAGTSARSWPWSGPRRTRRRCSILCCSRERERESGEMLVCVEKNKSPRRDRASKRVHVSSTTTTRVLSLLGRKEQHQRREESIAKDNRDDERKDARKQRGTIDRSIDRFYALLVIFTISFALTTTQKGPPTPKALSNI